jgi:hypothetical protein
MKITPVLNYSMLMDNQKQMLNIGKEEIIIVRGRMEMILSESATKEKKTGTGNQDKITITHSHPTKIQKFLSVKKIHQNLLHSMLLLPLHKIMIAQYQSYVWMQKLKQALKKKLMKQKKKLQKNLKQNQRKKKHLKQLCKLNLNQV